MARRARVTAARKMYWWHVMWIDDALSLKGNNDVASVVCVCEIKTNIAETPLPQLVKAEHRTCYLSSSQKG